MQGIELGAIIGSIMESGGSRRNKKKKPSLTGCWIIGFIAIFLATSFCALNTWAGEVELDNPSQPVWLTPLAIFLSGAILIAFLIWIKYVNDKYEKESEPERIKERKAIQYDRIMKISKMLQEEKSKRTSNG